ncbi:helix-turn-helix transcriptional regulator [Mucilaginibacter robiniae]|uniref:Helix-turn-helix transcriptional regulator n=1 Tax=Mucilaginibacter robiniae TaxID=2728022 RepID=A0A7L5E078_9SPHI|nr:helix-turn-helix transcriptional regulator [Mucilaginibacter robiniae]QJD96772.1 helix-turn-helix transcriptional regulator [Mucilaginibacter robiniae]
MSDSINNKAVNSVGTNIRTLRHQRGWSQEYMANRLGISIPAFSKIETGITDVNLSRLEQIATIFEISVVQLLGLGLTETEKQYSSMNKAQQKLIDREAEITNLQRKVIELYEELHSRHYIAV